MEMLKSFPPAAETISVPPAERKTAADFAMRKEIMSDNPYQTPMERFRNKGCPRSAVPKKGTEKPEVSIFFHFRLVVQLKSRKAGDRRPFVLRINRKCLRRQRFPNRHELPNKTDAFPRNPRLLLLLLFDSPGPYPFCHNTR